MDLEELSKHQIILLTLFVSFVTSVATGVVTVSLMQQAPPSVTHTINQIVEHTVQSVAPAQQGAAAVMTTKTIVVKDDDLVAQSIANLQKSIIRITAKGSDDLVARGVIVDARGTALTDKGALADSGATAFEAILADGRRVPVEVQETSTTTALAVLAVAEGSSTVPAATLAASDKILLGSTVIRIGGKGVDSVGEGVVAQLPDQDATIQASVQSSTPGSVLATRFGEVIGLATSASLAQGADRYTLATIPTTTAKEPNSSSKP
jgi:S1-C subfamily serine protease